MSILKRPVRSWHISILGTNTSTQLYLWCDRQRLYIWLSQLRVCGNLEYRNESRTYALDVSSNGETWNITASIIHIEMG